MIPIFFFYLFGETISVQQWKQINNKQLSGIRCLPEKSGAALHTALSLIKSLGPPLPPKHLRPGHSQTIRYNATSQKKTMLQSLRTFYVPKDF